MKPIAPPTGDPRPDPSTVGAIVVTYHPDAGLYERVRVLHGQVKAILIVDNGSTQDELAPVQLLVAEGVAEAVFNGRNVGQAAALNQGLAWGQRGGLAWIATFDQDTVAAARLVEEAGRVFEARRDSAIAVIGAGWYSVPKYPVPCDDPGGVEIETVITSGALHSVEVWRTVGGFRADFFIDFVDIEFCLRVRRAGYAVAQVCVHTMRHAIGNPTRRRFLFRQVQPSNHNRFRRYFITRNRIHVWRLFWRHEPRYVARDMWSATKEVMKLLLFEKDRSGKVKAMLRGAAHAIHGITGPLESERTAQ